MVTNYSYKIHINVQWGHFYAQMLVTKKKRIFEKFDTQIKMPANLNVQVWDNDALSADDFLGKNNAYHLSIAYIIYWVTHTQFKYNVRLSCPKNSEHKY